MEQRSYADVLLPLAVPKAFTYAVPVSLRSTIMLYKRVVVQFGGKKVYSALVVSLHNDRPVDFEPKKILDVIDEAPVITQEQMRLWEWMSRYYMCTPGEVMKAALPASLKLESETRLHINEGNEITEPLSEDEQLIMEMIRNEQAMYIADILKCFKNKNVLSAIKKLVSANILCAEEILEKDVSVRTEILVSLANTYTSKDTFSELCSTLEKKAPKQLAVLSALNTLSLQHAEVTRKMLVQASGQSMAVIQTLVKKGIITISEKVVQPQQHDAVNAVPVKLSDAQNEALTQIKESFKQYTVSLLHGITSSGKTEIYMHLIHEQIQSGKQVLYLLPEIALTTQIITRLQQVFGDVVGVYHSKFSDTQRMNVWNSVSGNTCSLILGVRSSVFLPFHDLGLIIVDEEHENSYKQFDPAPRYNARDTAIMLAGIHNAKVLLGTATPSIETYYNVQTNRYGLIALNERFRNIEPPHIVVVNVRDEIRKKRMSLHFSQTMIDEITTALNKNEQVMLFQNRRGYSYYLQCRVCGWIPNCKHCDVSLTYHKTENKLICHYCGYTHKNMSDCTACGSHELIAKGFGTEKIEDEIPLLFPNARVARLDVDTARTRKSYETILSAVEHHEVDILIGTQMISKGLDFGNVSVVGIMDADGMLNFPDFRAHERSFQLMLQVSGRAGRMHKQGKVVIQTYQPENIILQKVMKHDYTGMFNAQIEERKAFNYPPFCRLLRITVQHKKKEVLDMLSLHVAKEMQKHTPVMGPEYALIPRIAGWYQKDILVKLPKTPAAEIIKQSITTLIQDIHSKENFKSARFIIDVDPM